MGGADDDAMHDDALVQKAVEAVVDRRLAYCTGAAPRPPQLQLPHRPVHSAAVGMRPRSSLLPRGPLLCAVGRSQFSPAPAHAAEREELQDLILQASVPTRVVPPAKRRSGWRRTDTTRACDARRSRTRRLGTSNS